MIVKVQVCVGARCSFFGAIDLVENLNNLSENLAEYVPDISADSKLEVELLPCDRSCRERSHRFSPQVYINGEQVVNTSHPAVMELILNILQREG